MFLSYEFLWENMLVFSYYSIAVWLIIYGSNRWFCFLCDELRAPRNDLSINRRWTDITQKAFRRVLFFNCFPRFLAFCFFTGFVSVFGNFTLTSLTKKQSFTFFITDYSMFLHVQIWAYNECVRNNFHCFEWSSRRDLWLRARSINFTMNILFLVASWITSEFHAYVSTQYHKIIRGMWNCDTLSYYLSYILTWKSRSQI